MHQWRRTTKSKFETLAYAPLITAAVYLHGNSSQLQTTPIKSAIGCCCFCCHVTDMKSTEAVAWRLRDSHWPYAICAPPNLLFTVLNYHVPHETGHLDPCRGYTSHVQANPYFHIETSSEVHCWGSPTYSDYRQRTCSFIGRFLSFLPRNSCPHGMCGSTAAWCTRPSEAKDDLRRSLEQGARRRQATHSFWPCFECE